MSTDRPSETTTIKLLDAWKTKKGFTSDNQAAIALGISRTSVSTWRHGKAHASASLADRMATDLGLDALRILAAIEADRAYSGDDRRVWQRHGRAAFMALLVGLQMGLSPGGLAHVQSQQGSQPTRLAPEVSPLCEIPRRYRKRRYQPPRALAA